MQARARTSSSSVWALVVGLGLIGLPAAVHAGDDKDTSGRLVTWSLTRDGKEVIGSESLRVVDGEGGKLFASGELHLKTGKKTHRLSHLQRDGGKVVKYQRVESGLKGAGVRLFEWQGQMRVAPINAPGKPSDVGELPSGRVFDEGMWHLYATWGLPKSCASDKVAYFDVGKREAGEATLKCVGSRKVWDDKGKAVEVNQLAVGGVPGEGVELWVDGHGELVGVKGESRWMLRSKFALEAGKEGDKAPAEDDTDKDAIKDRGVGE